MSNINSIIAEVKTRLRKFDTAGVLDEDLMYSEVISSMKAFGNDITILTEDVVEISNGKGKLPTNFYYLKSAMLAEPYRCNKEAVEYRSLVGLSYIQDIKLIENRWNECDDCCNEVTDKYIRKEHWIGNSVKPYVDYKRVKYLRLGKSFDKKNCFNDFRQMCHKDEKDEIIIVKNEIRTNFKEGSIYMQYKGFELDEEGEIDIPDTSNGHLHKYLVENLIVFCLRDLINNGVENVPQSTLQLGLQELPILKHKAIQDLRMKDFSLKRLTNKIIANSKRDARINSVI